MSLILDCSVALAWCFEDEASVAVETVMRQVLHDGAHVTGIWHLEVANGLMMGIRRGRYDDFRRNRSLQLLSELDIRVDQDTSYNAWGVTMALAEQYRLTLYDASYLELALRQEMPLASLDKDLRSAAQALAIPVLGL